MNRSVASGGLLLVIGALLACKKDPPEETEVPTTPVAEPAEASVMEPTVPTTEAPTTPEGTPTPTPTAAPKPTTKATATATTTASTQPTTSAPSATTTASAPPPASQACLSNCRVTLANCLTPKPVDGGLPKLPDVPGCQKAFSDCQTACQQK